MASPELASLFCAPVRCMSLHARADELMFHALRAAAPFDHVPPRPVDIEPALVGLVLERAATVLLDVPVAEGLARLGVDASRLGAEERRSRARYRALLLDHERRLVERALGEDGVPFVHLKGVLHDAMLHRGEGRRGSRDVDVLVAKEHEAAAASALGRVGYRRAPIATHVATEEASRARLFIRSTAERTHQLDLHVALVNDPPFRDPTRAVLERAVVYDTSLGPMRGLAREDLLLHLAANLGGDRFRARLPLAYDAAVLLATQPVDLERVALTARAWRSQTATWALLSLVVARFALPVAPAALAALRPPRPVARWVARIAGVDGPPLTEPSRTSAAIVVVEWPLTGRPLWPVTATTRWARLRTLDRLRARGGWDRGR